MGKGKVKQGKTKASDVSQQGATQEVRCDICKATFKNKRGLAGHMAGRHGVKWGMNATLDNLCQVIEEASTNQKGFNEGLSKAVESHKEAILALEDGISGLEEAFANANIKTLFSHRDSSHNFPAVERCSNPKASPGPEGAEGIKYCQGGK